MDNGYLSLQEATKYCDYSQEYLSLRARQGKLRALKFGRNWVTKKEWIEEYFKKTEEYKNNFNSVTPSSSKFSQSFVKNFAAPPKNLPIEKMPALRFGFFTALVFVLLIAAISFNKISFQNVFEAADPFTRSFSNASDVAVKEIPKDAKGFYVQLSDYTPVISEAGEIVLAKTTKSFTQSLASVSADISDFEGISKKIGEWFSFQIKEIARNYMLANEFLEYKISQGYKKISQLWQAPEGIEEEPIVKPTEEGLFIVLSTEKDMELKEKIKTAFSDEIKMEPKDETSGFITPVFKGKEGEKYLYILVPIKN